MKSFTIKAYGQKWKVKVLKKHPKLKGMFGRFDGDSNIIYIDAASSEYQQKAALLHEIIHLIEFCNGMDYKEEAISILESGLYMVIHDNKLRF